MSAIVWVLVISLHGGFSGFSSMQVRVTFNTEIACEEALQRSTTSGAGTVIKRCQPEKKER